MTVVTTHVAMDTISCHYKWVTFNDQLVIHAIKTKVLYQHRSFVMVKYQTVRCTSKVSGVEIRL